MDHAAVTTMMRDTPAAAATAAENSTQQQQQHIAQSGVDMCCSRVVKVLGSLHAGAGGLDAWMLGWFIRRLPYHSLATCFASGTGVKILDDRPRPRAAFCIANQAASPWPAQPLKEKEMRFEPRRGVVVVNTYRSAHQPPRLMMEPGSMDYWSISHVLVSDLAIDSAGHALST